VVFSIILIVLYSLLSRSFVQPIAALTEAAARLSGGDIETRVRVPPQSEIGNLALAFNEMASRIQDTRQRLLGANEALKTNNERLSRSNVDLQAFVYAASHDLREPLRMVNSYLGLIDRRLQDRGELHEFLDFARDGASRMKRLLDDLLIYCRLEGGQVRSAEESLAVVAQEARDNLRLVFEETSAELSIGVLPTVLASHSQLLQLFQNLLSNAIKFRSAERPHIRISADRADQEWTVRISDNGIGFDPAEAERIFSAFHRLHSHAAIPGSGLGLAICQRIVVGWGGRIWATSQPGRGATFHFTFPRERIVRNDA
jgi:light-regulated signal transduction histidine kinase (bacteriophytochrome)